MAIGKDVTPHRVNGIYQYVDFARLDVSLKGLDTTEMFLDLTDDDARPVLGTFVHLQPGLQVPEVSPKRLAIATSPVAMPLTGDLVRVRRFLITDHRVQEGEIVTKCGIARR